MPICKKCNKRFPNREKIDGVHKQLSSRKFCLDCSPFGTLNRKDLTRASEQKCNVCKRAIIGTRRKRCDYCTQKIRRYRVKAAGVKYLGGKCIKCGYDKNIGALQFHHIGDDKLFQIGEVSNRSWEFIVKELEKCVLLCANCHQIEHSDYENEDFLKEVANYKGDSLDIDGIKFG